jgi:hypothetical protein
MSKPRTTLFFPAEPLDSPRALMQTVAREGKSGFRSMLRLHRFAHALICRVLRRIISSAAAATI